MSQTSKPADPNNLIGKPSGAGWVNPAVGLNGLNPAGLLPKFNNNTYSWDPGGLFGHSSDKAARDAAAFATRSADQHQAGNPYWQQQGSVNDASSAAYDAWYQAYGRAPTSDELAEVLPSYDPSNNVTNIAGGNAAVAQMHSASENTPAKIYARQQAEWQANAPKYSGSINQMTQSLLGRAATQDELDHYGTLIASGQADAYQIQQFMQSTPEYQNAQDTQFRSGVDTQLQQSDTNFFNTQKGNIAQQYALMGRATSPALDVALTQLASQLNSQRGSYLAQLSASQYGGNKQAALSNYQNTQGQIQNQINQNTAGIYNNYQNQWNRSNQLSDYQRQQATFNQYAKQGQGGSTMGYLNAAGSGAAAGSSFGPYGALIGAGVGAAGYGASQNGY